MGGIQRQTAFDQFPGAMVHVGDELVEVFPGSLRSAFSAFGSLKDIPNRHGLAGGQTPVAWWRAPWHSRILSQLVSQMRGGERLPVLIGKAFAATVAVLRNTPAHWSGSMPQRRKRQGRNFTTRSDLAARALGSQPSRFADQRLPIRHNSSPSGTRCHTTPCQL